MGETVDGGVISALAARLSIESSRRTHQRLTSAVKTKNIGTHANRCS